MFHAFLCIFDCTFALILISENCISILEHVDCSPFDKLLGSGKRPVIRDSEICVFEMFGVFKSLPFRADGLDILVIEVLYRSVNLNYAFCNGCKIVGM